MSGKKEAEDQEKEPQEVRNKTDHVSHHAMQSFVLKWESGRS